MGYIGHTPTNAGTFYILDDITLGSGTTYTMQVGGVDVTPSADNLLITLDGVIQHAGDAYTVSGSNIVFASGPGSGVEFYGIIMGQSATVGQGSIGADELKVSGDGTNGQVLVSDGDGTFSWATDTEAYVPLAGGTMTGTLAMGSNNITGTGTIGGTLTTASQTNITGVGTITTGVWQGTAIASAYLDADTAHLSGTQTFSGAKTFTGGLTIDPSGDNYVTMTSGATDANLGFLFKNSSDVQKGFILFDSDDSVLKLDSDGDIYLDAGGADIVLLDDGTHLGTIKLSSSALRFDSQVSDQDITFTGNDGGSAITAMTLDMSAGGRVGIGAATTPDSLLHAKVTTNTSENIKIQNDDSMTTIGVSSDGYSFHTYQHSLYWASWDGSTWSTKARMDSSGNFGLGTTAPTDYNANADNLVIYETGDDSGITLVADNDRGSNIYFADAQDDNVGGITYNHNSNYMNFRINGSERMRITSGGNVGIGDTNPARILTLKGASNTDGIRFLNTGFDYYNEICNNGDGLIFRVDPGTDGGSGVDFRWTINDTERLRLVQGGTLQPGSNNTQNLGTTSLRWSVLYTSNAVNVSDETLKTDIQDCDLGIDFINTLKPKSFKMKDLQEEHDDYNKKHYGLIAQDLKDGKLKDSVYGDKDGDYGLAYNDLVAPLIKAVQELSAKVEALENA